MGLSEIINEEITAARTRAPRKKPASRWSLLKAALRVSANITFGLLFALMALLVFLLVQSRVAERPPSLAGYQVYIVLSGSMNPTFNTGSLVFVRPLPPETIAAGDIITYKSPFDATLTTHRVVGVNPVGERSFITRGDANNVNDPVPVPAGSVIGKVYGSLAYLGYLMNFAQQKKGLLLLVIIPCALIILYEIGNLYVYAAGPGRRKKDRAPRGEESMPDRTVRSRSKRQAAFSGGEKPPAFPQPDLAAALAAQQALLEQISEKLDMLVRQLDLEKQAHRPAEPERRAAALQGGEREVGTEKPYSRRGGFRE